MNTIEVVQRKNDSNSIEVGNQDFEQIKQECKNSAEVNDIYNNPVVKAGLKFFLGCFPFFGDLVEAGLDWGFNQFQNKKQEILRDAILENKELITKDKVNDVEFICNLIKTSEMVSRLATDEKIVYFGNLVRNGYLSDARITNDDFEEYAAILNDLSYREIQHLIFFAKNARENDRRLKGEHLDEYCEKMQSLYPNGSPIVTIKRLQRTGFINDEVLWNDDGNINLSPGKSFYLDSEYDSFETIVLKSFDLKKRF